ncbi:MAG: alpha/beta hydrolase [Dehalococcoidia bacterium]
MRRGARRLVAGHDWGGIVAWAAGMWYPERMERLAILNVPHPAALRPGRRWCARRSAVGTSPPSNCRGCPRPPCAPATSPYRDARSATARAAPAPSARTTSTGTSTPSPSRGALTATVNYYRALARGGHRLLGHGLRRIEAPTLVIWGEQDPFVESAFAVPDPAWVPHARVERLPQAGHWAHLDEPDRVCDLLIRWAAFGLHQV